MEFLDRITCKNNVMLGKPCIRNMFVTVGMIVRQIGEGHSIEILDVNGLLTKTQNK